MNEIIQNLTTIQIVVGAAVLMLGLNTDFTAVLGRFKHLKDRKSQGTVSLLDQIRQLREETCVYPPDERNAIASHLDEIERAFERSMIEVPAETPTKP